MTNRVYLCYNLKVLSKKEVLVYPGHDVKLFWCMTR